MEYRAQRAHVVSVVPLELVELAGLLELRVLVELAGLPVLPVLVEYLARQELAESRVLVE